MKNEPYYLAYENRYKNVFAAGVDRWGHLPNDKKLVPALTNWVENNNLKGKRIIEFACGEGAGGEILSELGCIYYGVDIAPSAIEKSKKVLERYPNACVSVLDMVNEQIVYKYDAAVDIMGFHMLVLDDDRTKYLKNAFNCLKNGAPMLFLKQSYRRNAPASNEKIESMEQWTAITGEDYNTPQPRTAQQNGMNIEVNIPLVPARAKNKEGYIKEFEDIGFVVDDFIEMETDEAILYSASIYVRKP